MDEFISTLKKDESTVNANVKIIDGFKIEIDSAGTASEDNACSSPFGCCYDRTSRSPNPRFNTSHRTPLGGTSDTACLYGYGRQKVRQSPFDGDDKVLRRSLTGCDGASRWTNDRNPHAFDRADLCKNTDQSKPNSDKSPENAFETAAKTVMILDMGQKSPCIQYRSEIMKSGAFNPQGVADPELEKSRRASVNRANPPCNPTTACVGTGRDSNRDENLILKEVKSEFVNSIRENFTCNSYQTVPLDLSLPKSKPTSKKSRILSGSHESNLRHETSDVKSTKESALDLRLKTPSSVSKDEKCSDKTQSPPFGALPVQDLNPTYSYLSGNEFGVKTRSGEQSSGRNVIYKPIPKYPECHTGYANRLLQPFHAPSVMADSADMLNNEHIFGSGKYAHGTKRHNEMPWMHYGNYGDYDMVWNYSTTVTPALMQHPRPGAYLPSHLAHTTASLPAVPGLYSQKSPWCTDYDYLPSPHRRTSAFFNSESTPQKHASMNLTNSCSKERADQQYKHSSGNIYKGNYPIGVSHNTSAGYGPWSYLCPDEPTIRSHDDDIYATKLSQGAGFTAAPVTFGQTERTQTMPPGRLFQRMPGSSHGATPITHLGFSHGATSRTNLELPYGVIPGSNLGFPRGAAAYGHSNELDARVKGYKYNPDVHHSRMCKDRSVQKHSLGNPIMQQPVRDKNESNVNERSSTTETSTTDYSHPNSCSLSGRVKERGEVISDNKCASEKSATASNQQVKPRRQNKVKTPSKKCPYSDDEGDSSVDKKDGSQPTQSVTDPARKRRTTTRRPKGNQDGVGGRDKDAALNKTLRLHKHNIVSSMSADAAVAGPGRKEDTCLLASLLTNANNPQNNYQMDQSTSKRFKSAVDCIDKTHNSTLCAPEEQEKVHLTPCTDAIKCELSEIPEAAHCSSGRSPQELLEEGIIKKLTEIINDRTAEPDHQECPRVGGPRTKSLAETDGEKSDVTRHRVAKTEPDDETITVGLNYDQIENKMDLVVHDNTVSSAGCGGGETADTVKSTRDERVNVNKEAKMEGNSFVKDITLKSGEVTSSVGEIPANKFVPNVTSSSEENISSVAENCSRDGRQYKCPDCDYRCSTLSAFQQHQSKQCYAATKQEVSVHATDCLGKSGKFSVCQCTPCSLCKGIFSSKFRVFSHFKRGCFTKSRYCVEYKDVSTDLQQDRELVTSVRKIESIDYRLKFLSDANMNSPRVSDETRGIWDQHTHALTQKPAHEDRGAQTDGADAGSARNSTAKNPAMKTRKALNHGRDSKKGEQLISALSYNRKTASLDSDHVVSETELNDSKLEENTSPDAGASYCIKTEPVSPVMHYEIIVTDRCNMSKNGERRTPPCNFNSQGMKSDSSVSKSAVVGEKPALPNKQDITKGHTTGTNTSTSTTSTATSGSTMEEGVDVKLELVDDDCDVGGKTDTTNTQDASCRPVKSETVASPKPWEEIESNPSSRSPRKYTSSEDKSTAKLHSPAVTGKESTKKRCLDHRFNFSTTENQKFQTLWSPSNSAREVTPHVPKIYIVDKKGSPKVLAELGNAPVGLNKESLVPHTFLVNKRRCKRKRCQINDEKADLTFPASTSAVSQKTSTRQFDVESPLATLRVNTGNMSQNLPLKTAIAFGESQRVNKNGEKERIMYLLDANNKPVMLVEKIGKNNAEVHLPSPESM